MTAIGTRARERRLDRGVLGTRHDAEPRRHRAGVRAEFPPEVALGIHAIALVNELGAAAKVDGTGVRFRGYLRTAWTNPPEVVAKISAITGNDIVTGKATEPAEAIAAGAPELAVRRRLRGRPRRADDSRRGDRRRERGRDSRGDATRSPPAAGRPRAPEARVRVQ